MSVTFLITPLNIRLTIGTNKRTSAHKKGKRLESTLRFEELRQPGRQLRHISEQRQRPNQVNDEWADFLDD